MKNILLATTGANPQVLTETLYAIHQSGKAFPNEILVITRLSTRERLVQGLFEQGHLQALKEEYNLPDFSFANTIDAQVKKAQARVDKLTQSILAKAFRGELVPQDPNDEPADKLLERIAAARKEAEALAKAVKKAGRKTAKA